MKPDHRTPTPSRNERTGQVIGPSCRKPDRPASLLEGRVSTLGEGLEDLVLVLGLVNGNGHL
jgi:hypothetical protein